METPFQAMWRRTASRIAAYGLAAILIVSTLLVRAAASEAVGNRPLLILFVIPVLLTAYVGGLGPGLLATALAALGTATFRSPPDFLLDRARPEDWLQWMVLWGSGILGSVLVEALRRARRRSETVVTEQKAARREWEAIFDGVPDLVALFDARHQIVRVNRALAQRLGISPSECVGMTCYRCIHGSESPPASCPHALAVADGLEHRAELYEERLGGHFLVTCTPLADERGRPARTIHVARDITDRKRAEESLRESEEFGRQVFESIMEGLVVLDRNLLYRMWNRFMEEISGLRAAEVLGRHPDELFPWMRRQGLIAVLERALAGETTVTEDHPVPSPTGKSETWVMGRIGPLRDARGRIVGVIVMLQDVTQRKRGEEALLAAKNSAERAKAEAEKANKAKDEWHCRT